MRRIGAIVAGAGLFLLTGCEGIGFLSPAGPVARAQSLHFWIVCAVMMVVVVPIFVAIPYVLWRFGYREGRGTYRPDWKNSAIWETFLWGGPLVVTAVLAVVLWTQTQRLDPYRPLAEAPFEVQVIGYDWGWMFVYPDPGVTTVNRLVFPAGRAVSLSLTSDTVMQSFLLPELAGQIYLMNGMTTRLNLKADHPGHWTGRNTQYNGRGFHRQSFEAEALSPADFAAWADTARAAPPFDERALSDHRVATFGTRPAPAGSSHLHHEGTP